MWAAKQPGLVSQLGSFYLCDHRQVADLSECPQRQNGDSDTALVSKLSEANDGYAFRSVRSIQ